MSAFLRFDLFNQIGIRNLLPVTNYIHAFGIPGVLNIAAENDGGVFFVKLHHVANAVHLFTRHERRAAAAEGINDHGVLLRGVADGIAAIIRPCPAMTLYSLSIILTRCHLLL